MQIDADDFIKMMEEERRNHPVKMNKGLAIECIETQRQFVDELTREAFDMAIKALEEPEQPGWILWDSGGFPEESGTYTVTAYDGVTNRVTYAKYQKRLKRWELTGARAYWRVLAWMEKPKPWEGVQE